MKVKTVPTQFDGKIEIKRELICQCPHADMEDVYELTVIYEPGKNVVELEAFRDYLDDYGSKELTQEDVTEKIYADLDTALDSKPYVALKGSHFGEKVKTMRGGAP